MHAAIQHALGTAAVCTCHAVGPRLIWRFSFWRCSFPVTLTHGCWFVKTFFSSLLKTWLRARKCVGIKMNSTCFIKLQVLFSPAVNSLFIVTLECTDWWCKLLAARKIQLAMISSPVVMSKCCLPYYDWRCWFCTKAHLGKWTRSRNSANHLTQGVLHSCVAINFPKI